MTDYIDTCAICTKWIGLDEACKELRNIFGYPRMICSECIAEDRKPEPDSDGAPPGYGCGNRIR